MRIRPLVALVVKDLRVFFTDRYSVVLAFAAPIGLASFMAVVFGGSGPSKPSAIQVRVVDQDGGELGRAMGEAAAREGRLALIERDEAGALDDVLHSRAVLAVILPAGFSEAAGRALTQGGAPPALKVVHDPTRSSDVSLGRGLLTQLLVECLARQQEEDPAVEILDELASEALGEPAGEDDALERAAFLELFPGVEKEGDPEAEADRQALAEAFPGLADLVEGGGSEPSAGKGLGLPFRPIEESILPGGAASERSALAAHAFAGMVVQFVLFSSVEWGVALLIERQRGLWKRLRASSVSWGMLMTGKVLGCSIVSLLITLAVFGSGSILFGFGLRGEIAAFAVLAVSFSWASANFGLVVAAIGKTPQGARSVAVMAVLFLVMLGGGWIPTFLFPEWLQKLTPAIPTRWAIDGFDGVFARGYGLGQVLPLVVSLLGFGSACSVGALVAYRASEPR